MELRAAIALPRVVLGPVLLRVLSICEYLLLCRHTLYTTVTPGLRRGRNVDFLLVEIVYGGEGIWLRFAEPTQSKATKAFA